MGHVAYVGDSISTYPSSDNSDLLLEYSLFMSNYHSVQFIWQQYPIHLLARFLRFYPAPRLQTNINDLIRLTAAFHELFAQLQTSHTSPMSETQQLSLLSRLNTEYQRVSSVLLDQESDNEKTTKDIADNRYSPNSISKTSPGPQPVPRPIEAGMLTIDPDNTICIGSSGRNTGRSNEISL